MTDDLRDLVDPLLADPPHPAPPLDELQDRVHRRHRRRARAIAVCSIITAVLVTGAVLSLPRSTELQTGAPTPPTMIHPPPFAAGPVTIVVTPDSAPLDAARLVTVRNAGDQAYGTCAYSYDLYRWDGSTWRLVVLIAFGTNPPTLTDASAAGSGDQCNDVTTIAPGHAETKGFRIASATWRPTDDSTPPRNDQLEDGLYELREPRGRSGSADQRPLGRFEITPTGSPTKFPPPYEDEPVMLHITPESAPLDTPRTLEIGNNSDKPYFECGWAYGLDRWDGRAWQSVAVLYASPDGPQLDSGPDARSELDCASAKPIDPGSSRRSPFDLAHARRRADDGTTPMPAEPLEPGWYRLRSRTGASSDLPAIGLFEIKDPDSPLGTRPAIARQPPASVDVTSAPS